MMVPEVEIAMERQQHKQAGAWAHASIPGKLFIDFLECRGAPGCFRSFLGICEHVHLAASGVLCELHGDGLLAGNMANRSHASPCSSDTRRLGAKPGMPTQLHVRHSATAWPCKLHLAPNSTKASRSPETCYHCFHFVFPSEKAGRLFQLFSAQSPVKLGKATRPARSAGS